MGTEQAEELCTLPPYDAASTPSSSSSSSSTSVPETSQERPEKRLKSINIVEANPGVGLQFQIDEAEERCRILEARKQEIMMKEAMRQRLQNVTTITELRALVRDMMFMLEEQSQTLVLLERDNLSFRSRLQFVEGSQPEFGQSNAS